MTSLSEVRLMCGKMKANQLNSASEFYRDWLMQYADRWGTYSVLTYPWRITPRRDKVIRHGKRFGRLLNQGIFGKYFVRRHKGLVSVYTVEERGGRHHLNYLIEKHPFVIPECIRYHWGKAIGSNIGILNAACVTTKPVYSPWGALGYVLKASTWEHPPEVYIPNYLIESSSGGSGKV